ncbi:NAD(P) transhydrogenase subunit alpha [bacterium]|jgi:H+-translocating NAD(P) transhydrogenase subunit alpha|nr:NAD(P) transhydrogenase subunit alpha [bacterium]
MNITILADKRKNESRVAVTPDIIKKLTMLKPGAILVESGLGKTLFTDSNFEKAGAKISDRETCLKQANLVLTVHPLNSDDLSNLAPNTITLSYMDPFMNKETVKAYAKANVTSLCIELVPRTTLAQKMDALSSQASLAGYVAVLMAANESSSILPMMMTPSGTIRPSKVFIIGAGVAGLQAIATAKRLGARVEAFDTRPVVEEQVHSLGAKFVKVDLGDTGQTKDGYAKTLTDDQLTKQKDVMAKHCAKADIVITTAQLFGRKAPIIVTKEMVQSMKPGSVIVDLAIETGGNVEGAELGKTVLVNGVSIIGTGNFPGQVSKNASEMYASNLYYFIEHFWNKDLNTFTLDKNDAILKGALLTENGQIVNEQVKG